MLAGACPVSVQPDGQGAARVSPLGTGPREHCVQALRFRLAWRTWPEDRAAADVLRGRSIASGVRILVVPGSMAVKYAGSNTVEDL